MSLDDDLEALARAVGVMDAPTPWTVGDTLGVILGLPIGYVLITSVSLIGGDLS